ncbi:MAG: hypothetical protein JXP73_14090 [Deltaproteobacteria bacterium]|nr:hypothetical protein [Deltaproteobacteria bacterium]
MSQASRTFALSLLLSGLPLLGCGPSIDAAAKTDIDRRVAALVPSGLSFPAPTAFAPKALVAGQWTQHKQVDEKGDLSLVTYKIVGEEGGAHWVEIANEGYAGKTVTKILLAVGDRMNPHTMEIRAVKTKDMGGEVREYLGPVLQIPSSWQSAVNTLAVAWQGLPQEEMSVVAGHFVGCLKARTDVGWGFWHATSTTWMHPAVPINSLVKSVGIEKPTTVELVGFGEVGATSEIP